MYVLFDYVGRGVCMFLCIRVYRYASMQVNMEIGLIACASLYCRW